MGATLAAGVAVGVAVALARTARERRAPPLSDEDRRLGLQPGEPATYGLQRMALGQIDLAIEQLQRGADAETAVHETRKALKRLRALLRLLEHDLGGDSYAREDAAVRDIARQLSGARDAQVMLATLDALVERHPRKLARRKGVGRLRRALVAERERMERHTLGHSAALAPALAQLHHLRGNVAAWQLPDRDTAWRLPDGDAGNLAHPTDRDAAKLLDRGLRDIYAQGRTRFRRAERKRGKDTHAMHRWRKRVKDLRYAAEMLQRRPRSKKQRRGASAGLRRLAERADALAEILGEDHDLAVLAARVRADSKPRNHRRKKSQRAGRTTRKVLLELIASRQRKLRKQALRDGERLYRRDPKKFARRLRR